MKYGGLVREAWAMNTSRRYRFLWILGLLAGGGSAMLPSGGDSQPGHTTWEVVA